MKQYLKVVAGALCTGVLLVALSGCDTPATLNPDIQMTISMPLMDERMAIGEEIAKADSIRLNPSDETQFQINMREENLELDSNGDVGTDRLNIDAQEPQTVSSKVGLIDVDDVPPETTPRVMFAELMPSLEALSAPYPPTLPVDAATAPKSIEEVNYDNFRYATFSDQTSTTLNKLRMSIANQSPFTLGPVTVYFSSTGDTSATGEVLNQVIPPVVFDTVAPYDSISATDVDLAATTVYGHMYIVTEVTNQAGTISPVPDGTGARSDIKESYLTITTDISALEVQSAEAKIPNQDFENDRVIDFDSPKLNLYNASLTDLGIPGINKLTLEIRNTLPVDVNLHYELPDFAIPETPVQGASFVTPTTPGNYASAALDIPANQLTTIEFELDNAVMQKPGGGLIDELGINLHTSVIGTGDEFAVLVDTDSISVRAYVHTLAIERVDGRVPDGQPITVDIDSFELEIDEADMPEGLSGMQASDISVDMQIVTHNVAATVDAMLDMTVYEPGNQTPKANYTRNYNISIGDGTVIQYIATQDSQGVHGNFPTDIINATLDNLFSEQSARIVVGGQVTVTGDVTLVRNQSRMEIPYVSVTSPLKFIVPGGLTFDAYAAEEEAEDLNMDQSTKDDMIPRAEQATLFVEMENHFPIGGVLVLYASSDPYFTRLRTDYPADDRDDISTIPAMMPATADIANEAQSVQENAIFELFRVPLPEPTRLADGSVDHDNPGVNEQPIEISLDDEMQLFAYENLYLLPRVQLNQSGDQLIQLRPDDYLQVSAMMFLTASSEK